jgi:hypothetical protein
MFVCDVKIRIRIRNNFVVTRSRDSSVGIAMGNFLDGQGSIPSKG